VRVLVTGAAGFVGSHICEAYAAQGADVVGIDSFTDYYAVEQKRMNAKILGRAGIELVEADLNTVDLDGLVADVDVVNHQAGQPGVRLSWSDGFPTYVARNVNATQRLLEAVLRNAPSARVVYASSSSVYGNALRYPVTEVDLPNPHSPYGVTKLAAEHLCRLYAANFGVHTVALRYFTVFGPRQRPDMSIHRLCEAGVRGGTFPKYGDGTQVREFTYVDDIVAANLLAAQRPLEPGSVFNIAGGAEITLNSLIALIEELTRSTIRIEQHDVRPGDSFRNGGAITRAIGLLAWRPEVSLRDGLARQLDWHRMY
jgi:UDP-glucuronate 4-epimerase